MHSLLSSIARSLVVVLVIAGALWAGPARAQEYSFSVPSLKMQVAVQEDASVRITYDITFANNEGAHAIDVVDIGVPHERYDVSNMSASIGGVALTDIRPSQYVTPGVEVHLDGQAIPAGGQGTLHFEFSMPDMVYQDTTRRDYASLQITPTWFGDQYVTGTTDIQIAILMLPGIQPDEVLFQEMPFTSKTVYDGRAVVGWRWPEARATGAHLQGVSFPQRGLARVVRITPFQALVMGFEKNEGARLMAALLSVLLLGLLYFRFTGGTGCVLFVPLLVGLIVLIVVSPAGHLISFPVLIALVAWNEWYLVRRGPRYLPPVAQVEGGGILRGLTAPEAAILLEVPLRKVLMLVLFGLLKKGVLCQTRLSPWEVEVTPPFRTYGGGLPDRKAERHRAAREAGAVLHPYEHDFLDVIEKHRGRAVADMDFGAAMKRLIEGTVGKMKGFDLSDTQDYYRAHVQRALAQARATVSPLERQNAIDRNLEWILIDENPTVVFGPGPYTYGPIWTRVPGGTTPPSTSGTPAGAASTEFGPTRQPGAGGAASTDFGPAGGAGQAASTEFGPGAGGTEQAASTSFFGWADDTAKGIGSAIPPGSVTVEGVRGGVVDLSGADKATADVFEAMNKASSSGGSGGGGGCACACAGCACACACAGGGR